MFSISPSTRLRPSPYFDATVADGVVSFTVYNRMLLPIGYGDPEEEYWRLIKGVSMWDVAVERQIELTGRDAGRLAQALAPRDLGKCVAGQGKYVPLCDHRGTLINDPILLKLEDDRYWLSIADSDVLFWARAVAAERGPDVEIIEADVAPLAVQGPKAEDVVASMFGDWVRDLRYFWFRPTEIDGIPLVVARSGWSKQGGFELFLMDGSKGDALWRVVKEAGRPWDIGPGCPNGCERIESGLISWGGDTDDLTNPYEVRMGGYVDLDVADDVVGIAALRRIHAEGPARHQLGIVLDEDEALAPAFRWSTVAQDGRQIGHMTNGVWSYRLERNIGFGLVSADSVPGSRVEVLRDGKRFSGTLQELPFI